MEKIKLLRASILFLVSGQGSAAIHAVGVLMNLAQVTGKSEGTNFYDPRGYLTAPDGTCIAFSLEFDTTGVGRDKSVYLESVLNKR